MTGLRCAELAALIFALAGTRLMSGGDSVTTLFAVDVSRSVPAAERGGALEKARAAVKTMRPDDAAGLIAFAAQPMVELLPQQRPQTLSLQTQPDPDSTDLSALIRLAAGLYPEGSRRRMAIFSDGNENRGDALEAARAAQAAGIVIDVFPINAPADREVSLTGVSLPSKTQKDEPFEMRVEAMATEDGPAKLRLFRDGRPIGERDVQLRAGSNTFSSTLTEADSGFHTYEATLESASDRVPENNSASGFTRVTGPSRVLLVGSPEDNAPLVAALQGVPFTLETARELPEGLSALQAFDAVYLNNVPAASMRRETMDGLERYERDLGGGLGMIGGENSFGPGGWIGTAVERALPVDMELKGKERLPSLSLVMVIDKSGSMGSSSDPTSKMGMAKQSIIEAIRLLGPRDNVGVVEFDSAAGWAVPLAPADSRAMEGKVRGIGGGGGTDVYQGMRAAYEGLHNAKTMIKHMIVLTDGQTPPAAFEELLAKMNEDHITASSVGIGPDADGAFLNNIAKAGGGRFYACPDPSRTPRIFVRETILAQRAYLVEETETPVIGASHEILSDPAMRQTPKLRGWVATELKARAEPALKLRTDPLLAAWQYGLGKSIAYTSDVQGRWSNEWVAWDGFGTFWDRVIRWSLRGADSSDLAPRVEFDGGRGRIVVDAVDAQDARINFLELKAALVTPGLEGREITLRQTSIGRYEAEFEADKPGAYMAGIVGKDGRRATTGGLVAYSPEFRDFGTNEFLLRELAEMTGGRFAPEASDLFRREGGVVRKPRAISGALLAAAVFLLLAEIAARRLALDDERRAWLRARLATVGRVLWTGRRAGYGYGHAQGAAAGAGAGAATANGGGAGGGTIGPVGMTDALKARTSLLRNRPRGAAADGSGTAESAASGGLFGSGAGFGRGGSGRAGARPPWEAGPSGPRNISGSGPAVGASAGAPDTTSDDATDPSFAQSDGGVAQTLAERLRAAKTKTARAPQSLQSPTDSFSPPAEAIGSGTALKFPASQPAPPPAPPPPLPRAEPDASEAPTAADAHIAAEAPTDSMNALLANKRKRKQ